MNKAKTPEKLDLKDLEKLHPVDREKVLRDLLIKEKNEKLLKIIKDEIEKAEEEQQEAKNLEDISKTQPKTKEKELDSLVRNETRELEEAEVRKENKQISGKLYSVKDREHQKAYEVYSAYNPKMNEHEHPNIKLEITSTTERKEEKSRLGEEQGIESGIKKMTDLYKKTKKEEGRSGY